jgi:integrase
MCQSTIVVQRSKWLKNSESNFVQVPGVLEAVQQNVMSKGELYAYLDEVKKPGYERTPVTSWCQRMSKVFKTLDIKHSLHSLRHTHASNLLTNNYPVLQLSHRLGHADPIITLSIYSHLVQGQELDVNNFLPNIGLKQVN